MNNHITFATIPQWQRTVVFSASRMNEQSPGLIERNPFSILKFSSVFNQKASKPKYTIMHHAHLDRYEHLTNTSIIYDYISGARFFIPRIHRPAISDTQIVTYHFIATPLLR